jgi:hypothetical protein
MSDGRWRTLNDIRLACDRRQVFYTDRTIIAALHKIDVSRDEVQGQTLFCFGGGTAAPKKNTATAMILDYLAENGPSTVADMQALNVFSRGGRINAFRQLESEGLIVRVGTARRIGRGPDAVIWGLPS